MAATKEQIEKVLEDARNAIDNKRVVPVDRKKNINTLAMLGLVWEDALEEIYTLNATHYNRGPFTDRDFPADDCFWEFKKSVLGHIIYIKFKIRYLNDQAILIQIFHFDEPKSM